MLAMPCRWVASGAGSKTGVQNSFNVERPACTISPHRKYVVGAVQSNSGWQDQA